MKTSPAYSSAPQNILIVADIEGSSGCWSYEASSFRTDAWALACLEMTRDIEAVLATLFECGVRKVTVKDFHRTGYNLLPELLDPRARLISGYRAGPVPGMGDPSGAEGVMFIGLHAASGTGGFLAHTLTSRISRLEVNGRLMTEVELFASSLAPFGLRPLFFSGCPAACRQAAEAIPGIRTFPCDKSGGAGSLDPIPWREVLSRAAADALGNRDTVPFEPRGPFSARVSLRDGGKTAEKLARRWNLPWEGDALLLEEEDIHRLYSQLIRLCYLTPFIEKHAGMLLPLYNLYGRWGLNWARQRLRKFRG